MLPKLQLLVELGRTKNEKSGMVATGIPPQVENFVRLEAIEASLAAMPGRIAASVGQELESRGVDAGNITQHALTTLITGQLAILKQHVDQKFDALAASGGPSGAGDDAGDGASGNEFEFFTYDGKHHLVPKDYKLPSNLTLLSAFRLYVCGNPALKICPLKGVKGIDFYVPKAPAGEAKKGQGPFSPEMQLHKAAKKMTVRFCKWKKLFNKMLKLIEDDACYKEKPTSAEAHTMYKKAIELLKPELKATKKRRRLDAVCPVTLYNEISKEAKRRKTAEAGDN